MAEHGGTWRHGGIGATYQMKQMHDGKPWTNLGQCVLNIVGFIATKFEDSIRRCVEALLWHQRQQEMHNQG
jgi:hypothetical protein